MHARPGRHVTTVDGLRKRVRAWSIHSGLGWRAGEIEDATACLSRRFYYLQRQAAVPTARALRQRGEIKRVQ